MLALLFLSAGIGMFVIAGMLQTPVLALASVFMALISLGCGRPFRAEEAPGVMWTTYLPEPRHPAETTPRAQRSRRNLRRAPLSCCPAYTRQMQRAKR